MDIPAFLPCHPYTTPEGPNGDADMANLFSLHSTPQNSPLALKHRQEAPALHLCKQLQQIAAPCWLLLSPVSESPGNTNLLPVTCVPHPAPLHRTRTKGYFSSGAGLHGQHLRHSALLPTLP